MPQRLYRLLLAPVFLLAAAACLSPAGRSLSQISRPHDLFALSLLASFFLAVLFVVAFVACIFPELEAPSTHHARRWVSNLAIALFTVGISLLVITKETPTSFVSWEQIRGAPLPWLEDGHFYGPCLGRPCRTYWPTSLKPFALLINLGLIIGAVHLVRRLSTRWSRPGQQRRIGAEIGSKSWPGGSSRGR
jgi:hypothetical protein